MKTVLALCVALAFCLTASAQDKMTPEEAKFLTEGPRLYTMADALELSKKTGRPTVCWMGAHLFANAEARKLSASLGETTIQAAMDTDGTQYDKVGFRVKFSTNNYTDGTTYFVPLARFSEPGMAEKILAKARGGK